MAFHVSPGSTLCRYNCTEWDEGPNNTQQNVTYETWDAPCGSVPGVPVMDRIKFSVQTEIVNGKTVAVGLRMIACNDSSETNDFTCNPSPEKLQEYLNIVNQMLVSIQQ